MHRQAFDFGTGRQLCICNERMASSALDLALEAATRRFEGRCDHRAAAHLNVLFLALRDGKVDVDEPRAIVAHAGIEALRCDGA